MDMDFWHWLGLVLGLLLIASIAIPVEFWYDWKRENRREGWEKRRKNKN